MPRRIVYTRPDGGVSICAPSETALRFLGSGGRWGAPERGFIDRQIAAQSADGVGERAATRFVRTMQFGGAALGEAYDIMRDRFCAHLGTGAELWDVDDVPADRWFRNAWRRSHNGGPIMIDMGAARDIQLARIGAAIDRENERRRSWLTRMRPLRIAKGPILDKIHRAQEPEDLRRIWPDELAA